MKRVFVCAGMSNAKSEKITQQALKLGRMLAKGGYIYVQGGTNEGLMGVTLQEFIKYSDKVEFIIPDVYYDHDSKALKQLFKKEINAKIVKGEAGRLSEIKMCDEIIVLPGGTGTLEELLFCNETGRSNEHTSPITVVNVDGYYDNFIQQMNRSIDEGLTKKSDIKFQILSNVEDLKLFKEDKKY